MDLYEEEDVLELNGKPTITFMGVNTDNVRYGKTGMMYLPSESRDKFNIRLKGGCISDYCFNVGDDQGDKFNHLAVIDTSVRFILLP